MKKRYYNQLTTEEFIAKARAVYGDKYDYSKVVYVNNRTKVCIICPEHGEFWMTPDNHLRGRRCIYCSGKKQNRPDLSHIENPHGSKAVPLTRGKYALVDEEDYERVMEHLWRLDSAGYAISTKLGMMHRFIMNTPEGMYTDHIDGDRLNNRKANLRICTYQENNYNRAATAGASSKYKGVSWHDLTGKWAVNISSNKKRKYVGLFTDEVEAARAYDKEAVKVHGGFKRLNFPQDYPK